MEEVAAIAAKKLPKTSGLRSKAPPLVLQRRPKKLPLPGLRPKAGPDDGHVGHEGGKGVEGRQHDGADGHESGKGDKGPQHDGNEGHANGDELQAAVQIVYDYGEGEVSRARLPYKAV